LNRKLTAPEFKARGSFGFEELVAASEGRLVEGLGPVLPSSILLPFHEITELSWDEKKGRGRIAAVRRNRVNDWLYFCHFTNDPVMPGCWGVDALWQAVRFFAAWRGIADCDRTLGLQDVSFFGQIRPFDQAIAYEAEIESVETEDGETRVTASGKVKVDGQLIYTVGRIEVGTAYFEAGEPELGAAPPPPPARRGEPLPKSITRDEFGRKTEFSLPELIAHSLGNLISPDGEETTRIPSSMMAGLEQVSGLSFEAESGDGRMSVYKDNSPVDWYFPPNHGAAPAAFLIDIIWQALGFFLGWTQHRGIGRALGLESVRVFDHIVPGDRRISCALRIGRVFEVSNGDSFVIGDATVFADDRPVLACTGAKVGYHKKIAYVNYPFESGFSRGGKLEL
jgi:3-hydroxyacyl-[acyl-carrier protein] dehydratase/trans-2-decenoyl-[acyl-carrier protein] isomerase